MYTGSLPLDLPGIAHALGGYYPTGEAATFTVTIAYGAQGRMRHFLPTCPPRNANGNVTARIWTRDLHLNEIDRAVDPRERHTCFDGFTWLPPRLRTELSLLADARALTRPWRSATYKTANRGYEVAPDSYTPLTSGLLEQLWNQTRAHAAAHPTRAHVTELATELEAALTGYSDAWARQHQIRDADPITPIRDWATSLGLPKLTGTEKQVRWAERIRHDAAHLPGWDTVAHRETGAGAWIGLHLAETTNLLEDWLDLRDRGQAARERAAVFEDRDRDWSWSSSRYR